MNLSNTSQYAIRVLSYMAVQNEQLYTAASLIAKLKVSDKYLKRILTNLSDGGILVSIQGRYGGFRLARPTDQIRLIDIVAAMENVEKYFGCILGFDQCSDENPCSLHTKWAPLRDELTRFLHHTTLHDVITNKTSFKF